MHSTFSSSIIKPFDFLHGISVDEQEKLIKTIETLLQKDPFQWFFFSGPPGCGKTFQLKAIHRNIRGDSSNDHIFRPFLTLTEWDALNLTDSRRYYEDLIAIAPGVNRQDARHVKLISTNRADHSSFFAWPNKLYFHIFLDEIDRQPTTSQFAAANFESLVNACYESPYTQLCVAANATFEEFVKERGDHIARRFHQRGYIIDFRKPIEPQIAQQDEYKRKYAAAQEEQRKRDEEFEALCASSGFAI